VLKMAVGQSDDPDPPDAIEACIDQCRAQLDAARPQAALLMTAFDSYDPTLSAAVERAFPGVEVVGTTSSAELSSVDGFREDSMVLALFASDVVDVTTGWTADATDPAAIAMAVREAMARTTRPPRVCILIVESFVVDQQQAIDAARHALPPGTIVLGGTSARSDMLQMRPTYQFRGDARSSDGAIVLLFSGDVAHSVAVGLGWRPLGQPGIVTGSAQGSIETIDGRPAVEYVKRYLDDLGPASFGNPLAIREPGSGAFYLRVIQAADPKTGAVLVSGLMPEGATIQVTTASTDEILGGTQTALREALASFPADATPDAALIFSCAIRKFVLGSRTATEGELVRDVLRDLPVAGMYCYGEVAPIDPGGPSRFHNETFVALLLGT
jgi:hypothetical protein